MTPAIDLLKKAKAEHRVHSYQHDPKAPSYGLEAAEKLGLAPECVFKTLLAATEKGELLVAVVPVVGSLDLKALAAAAGVKKADMADPTAAQRHWLSGRWHQPAGAEETLAHLYRRDRTPASHHSRQWRPARAGTGTLGRDPGATYPGAVRRYRQSLNRAVCCQQNKPVCSQLQ